MDIKEITQRLTMREVAEEYGFTPNRAGFICCPFHPDRTPSLKLYPEDRGWYCFGCQIGGSVIDFVMRLFDLNFLDAVRRINTDFNLALPLDQPPTAADMRAAQRRQEIQETYRAFEAWRGRTQDKLFACRRVVDYALRVKNPYTWTQTEMLAIRESSYIDYLLDCLEGTMEEKMDVFRDRKRVELLCNKILLNSTPMKSDPN